MKPKTLVLTGYGINCEEETAYAFDESGADSTIIHINDLIENPKTLEKYQILAIPGGFSYGDDTGSGNAYANKVKNNLTDQLISFAKQDKLAIGICNGFQILANTGLVPAINEKYGQRQIALMHNKTARYECRWVHLKTTTSKCVWTKDIDTLHVPIAHGEGNFYTEPDTLKSLEQNNQIAFKYTKPDHSPANQEFPHNPNGSLQDIAGVCDPSGRLLGMMPHPERFLSFTNEEGWPLKKESLLREQRRNTSSPVFPTQTPGLKIFQNAVNYFT
jgi:phosphoribosylformylglycinamidine synthase